METAGRLLSWVFVVTLFVMLAVLGFVAVDQYRNSSNRAKQATDEAIDAGIDAGWWNLPLEANPFEPGERGRIAWKNGWVAGRKKALQQGKQ